MCRILLRPSAKAEHVTDVYIDAAAQPEQGVFIAPYDSDGHLTPVRRIGRMSHTFSGYLKQSGGEGEEKGIPNFREAIKLIVDHNEEV